jgi:hypothetical protein
LKEKTMKSLVLAMSTFVLIEQAAIASLPDDQTVYYYIREDPQDEQSDVIFEVALDINPSQVSSHAVEWSVARARFIEIDSNGEPISSWTDADPSVVSSNGLWWVEHVDVEDPIVAEFNLPPEISGTADKDQEGDDLGYAFETGTLGAGKSAMYGGYVAAITHQFILAAEQEPIVDGEDEPVEVQSDPWIPIG